MTTVSAGGSRRSGRCLIPHQLGVAPVWAIAIASTAVSTSSGTDPVVCSPGAHDATNLVFVQETVEGGNCNFPGVVTYWLALY
jgi:hypothetical protein